MKAETRARGIDERCSFSGFTVTRRDGGGKQREKEGKRETARQVGSARPRLGGTRAVSTGGPHVGVTDNACAHPTDMAHATQCHKWLGDSGSPTFMRQRGHTQGWQKHRGAADQHGRNDDMTTAVALQRE